MTTAENMKNSTVISNPHATLNHVTTVLESPDGGVGGVDSETNSPLFGGRVHASGMGTLGSEQVRGFCRPKNAVNQFIDASIINHVRFHLFQSFPIFVAQTGLFKQLMGDFHCKKRKERENSFFSLDTLNFFFFF